MPNAVDNHYQFKKVNKFQIWIDDHRGHSKTNGTSSMNSYAYFSFLSNVGNKISVRVSFGEEQTKRQGQSLRLNADCDYDIDSPQPATQKNLYKKFSDNPLNSKTRTPSSKGFHKGMFDGLEIIDHIEENKEIARNWQIESVKRREINSQITMLRIKSTQSMKERLMLKNRKKSKRFIKRWEVVK